MNRRSFLSFPIAEKAREQAYFPMVNPPETGLDPYNGPWELPQAAHLLRRLMFGAKWDDVQFFLGLTPAQAVDYLLNPTAPAPPLPVNDYNEEGYEDPDVPMGEPWINAPYNDLFEGARIWSLKAWWQGNMIEQDRSIMEKMILFWHNHVPIQFYGVFSGRWDYRYLNTIRQSALGSIRQMIRNLTLDPAMLHYLNGQYNAAGAPDENYARELQELFCIGKGPDANYTEDDVKAAARVLTGWRVNYDNDTVIFNHFEHDSGIKLFSSFYNNAIITGYTGQNGMQELDELLDIIFGNDECALFLCRKLYRFFVHHEIDDLAEENVIIPLAEIMRNNDYQIKPVLEVLFKSQHFFDALSLGAMIKSPADYTISLYREFNTPIPPRTALVDRYQHNGTLTYVSFVQGQEVGDPPNVAGWPAYYQIPVFDKIWINTNTLPFRAQFADWILWAGVSTENYLSQLNILDTIAQIPNADDPNVLIDSVLDWMYGIEVSNTLKFQLKAILLSGQISDYYWTDAWNTYLNNPDNVMATETVRNRLLLFFYKILHQEEYHLS